MKAMSGWQACFLLALVYLLVTPHVLGATLRLVNGKVFRGEIVAETTHALHVKTAFGIIKLARRDVLQLENDDGAARRHFAVQLLDSLELGNFPKALKTLNATAISADGLELAETDRLLLEKFDFLVEFAKAQPQVALSALFDYILNRPSPPPPLLFARTFRLALSNDGTSSALSLLLPVLRRGWISLCDQEILGQALEACGGNEDIPASDRLLIATAAARIADVQSPTGQSLETKALSVAAEGLLDLLVNGPQNEFSGSFSNPAECDLPTSFSESELPVLFQQLTSLAQSRNSTETLVLCCEWIETNAKLAPRFDLRGTLRTHHTLLVQCGNFNAARQLAIRSETWDPDVAAELLLKTKFFEEKAKLAPDDQVARYRLAKWAYEMGLVELALDEFRRLCASKQLGRACYLYLKANKIQRDAEVLQHALDLFRMGLYSAAAHTAGELTQPQEKSDLTTETALVVALAKRLADSAPQREKLKAASLLQQAERLALRQDYSTAASLLETAKQTCPSTEISAAISAIIRKFPRLREQVTAPPTN
ncbi:MAG: hypothetical protein ACPL7D_01370 [Candidatus Sumerlaeaceae bacterium]|jgi:hypothetical protein